MRFSVGVNYWPQRSGPAMWTAFDPGEIRDDFAHIAALGLDTVRFFVRWDVFEPAADHVETEMLERLVTFVGLADDAGLRALPVLFSGHLMGINHVPAWALEAAASTRGRFPTMTAAGEAAGGVGNIYRGALLEAQVRLARAVGERLRGHLALTAWDIGHEFSCLRAPSAARVSSGDHSQAPADEQTIAAWSARLAQTLKTASGIPVTAGTFSGDLTEDRNLRLGSLCAPFAFASMQGSNVSMAFGRGRLDPEPLPFLAMLTAGFSYKPVLVTGFGNPTCPPGKFSAVERFAAAGDAPNLTISPDDRVFATYPCLTEDENAAYCTATLERLHADGRLGALWWCWSDAADEHPQAAPFDERAHWRSWGVIRADGRARPVAAALSAFARQAREVRAAADMPMIASAYYYRTLPTSTRTLFEAYLRFVAERRASTPT
jgi:hypothetical protein